MRVGELLRILITGGNGQYGRNFVKTMLELAEKNRETKVVDNLIGSPTYVKDLAETIIQLFSRRMASIM
jgi:dTDP-4-dehydrorhamnose reductase